MEIILQKKEQQEKRFRIPTGMLLNRLTAGIAGRKLAKHGGCLSSEQLFKLMQELKAVRERHPDWVLLEAEDANGEKFKIVI